LIPSAHAGQRCEPEHIDFLIGQMFHQPRFLVRGVLERRRFIFLMTLDRFYRILPELLHFDRPVTGTPEPVGKAVDRAIGPLGTGYRYHLEIPGSPPEF